MRARTLHRFGRVAGGALALLIISGTAMAAQHLPALRDLVATNYGRVLLLKIIAVADVALVASSAARLARRDTAAETRLRRWWRGELLLLAGILALAGLLVSLAPPG